MSNLPKPIRSDLAGRIMARIQAEGIILKPGEFAQKMTLMDLDRLALLAQFALAGDHDRFKAQLQKEGFDV